ncbi:hypothetical protein ACJX0J_023107 [Zea mays]
MVFLSPGFERRKTSILEDIYLLVFIIVWSLHQIDVYGFFRVIIIQKLCTITISKMLIFHHFIRIEKSSPSPLPRVYNCIQIWVCNLCIFHGTLVHMFTVELKLSSLIAYINTNVASEIISRQLPTA